ncbi:MAG TPA: AI-2E family transporter [Sphingomicrobium sp.]|nr:AI-2E family transporter [Sphingomicrobium sp.]
MASSKQPDADAKFVRRALIVIGLAALALLMWQLRTVIVLLFGAVVMGTIFRAIADPLSKHLRLPDQVAMLTSVLLIVALFVGVGWLLGQQIATQTDALTQTLPRALARVDQWLGSFGLAHPFQTWFSQLHSSGGTLVSRFGSWLSTASNGLANFLIVLFGGIFLAAEPGFYRTGAIKLVPPAKRALIAEAMDESERALRLWLKGQLIAMIVIGAMTATGLWLLGVQSWLVLGILAGFFEFIPFAGPILSAVPGILIALVQSPELALWTTLMYIFVQHSEAYLIQPIIQQYAVDVPAVVLLFSLLAFAVLFGVIGILFAAPLTVVTYVLVKRLYVIEALDTPTPIPGEDK